MHLSLLNLAVDISAIVLAGVALLVTIILAIITYSRENKLLITDKFIILYKLTFSLRSTVSKNFHDKLPDGQFFYEIDILLGDKDIENEILNYLTEIEDIFTVMFKYYFTRQILEKLMSYALYGRLASFYGFILKMRCRKNNEKMFLNYENAIETIENMKKIQKLVKPTKNIYYVGIRESDCKYAGKFFKGSITMFKENNHEEEIRPNQNTKNDRFIPYIEKEMQAILKKDSEATFLFYNASTANALPLTLQKSCVYQNSYTLLAFLSNKSNCKIWLAENKFPIIPYKEYSGEYIKKFRTVLFGQGKQYVLQKCYGGGGIGTYIVTDKNFEDIISKLLPFKNYMISEYKEYGVSVNTHIFISEKQTVLSPGSIQITEIFENQIVYRGADFISFRALNEEIKKQIQLLSLKIADLLREKGYRGVAGIDFLVDGQKNVYCCEINPRFQASSVLLDLYLQKKKNNIAKSIYELQVQSFKNILKSDLCFNDEINYSCYYYYRSDLSTEDLKAKVEILEKCGVKIDRDGVIFDEELTDENSYMFRAVFNHTITHISPDYKLWINENIPVRHFPNELINLKIALLNQGVRLLYPPESLKEGVYSSVDIQYFSDDGCVTDFNCAFNINYSQYSPFMLNFNDMHLYFYEKKMCRFQAEINQLNDLPDKFKKILYIATDRLRIKPIHGCEFKNLGDGCEFCDVPASDGKYELSDIKSALVELERKKIPFRHILIGGGTSLDNDIWMKIENIAKYLKSKTYFREKSISLMSILPPIEELKKLKDSGISEVAFNLEIADPYTAKKYMPAKNYNKKHFYDIMKKAVKIFGIGNVRSALIVGIDKEEDLINEVKEMAKSGIIPCLSAIRSLEKAKNTPAIHPTNDYLYDIYEKCQRILSSSDYPVKELGPKCTRCRNNMLSI